MISSFYRRILASSALLAALAIGSPAAGQTPGDTLDVFFLGNSYIYYNNLPGLVEAISRSLDGPQIRAGSHTHGGFSLRRHLGDGHVPAVMETEAPEEHAWDIVLLQEQSSLGTPVLDTLTGQLGDTDNFYEGAAELSSMIREMGADPVLYMTWAKERFPSQISDISEAYTSVGADLGIPVAPVGDSWAMVRQQRPDLGLHVADGSHPNAAGSYLAACVIYATITGRSPVGAGRELRGAPWSFSGPVAADRPTILVSLSPSDAEFLQRVAWDAVREQGAN